MAAGESARAEAQRVQKKIADLQRYAATYEQGAVGEELTAKALALLGPEWVVFHDLRWPGRLRANIDHVAIGPGGIFVIDSKNWSGNVAINDGSLRQNGYNRDKNVAGVADAALAVADLAGPYAAYVYPVLCFVQQDDLRGRVHDVLVCSTDNVTTLMASHGSPLSQAHVLEVATRIDGQVRSAMEPGRGYAPGPKLWVNTPAGGPRPARRAPSPHRRPAPGGSQASGARRFVRFLVAAALVIGVGLPTVGIVAPLLGQLLADIIVEDECGTAAESTEKEPRKARRSEQPTVDTDAGC